MDTILIIIFRVQYNDLCRRDDTFNRSHHNKRQLEEKDIIKIRSGIAQVLALNVES